MKSKIHHSWNVYPRKAADIQRGLRARVREGPPFRLTGGHLVAGADVSYRRGDERMFGGVVVMSYPDLDIVERRWGSAVPRFPYVPGLLTFREAPVLIPIFERLDSVPDLIFFDGHGLAHPRGMGLATHMGLVLGSRSVGVAKKVLVGEYDEPGAERGCVSDLVHEGRVVGAVLRTRSDVKPVFVSVGDRIDLDSARDAALSCARPYRLCEPIRAAHSVCNEVRAKRAG